MTDDLKICKTCGLDKPIGEFYVNKRTKKVFPSCKECGKAKKAALTEQTSLETPKTDGPTDIFKALGFPPERIKGQPNPEFYQHGYRYILASGMGAAAQGKAVPFNSESLKEMLNSMAKANGLDPKTLQDHRTKEQRAVDALERLIDSPREVWELIEEEADAIEQMMDKADRGAHGYISQKLRDAELPKLVRSLLTRIRGLRQRAQNPTSPSQIEHLMSDPTFPKADDWENLASAALEAAWPLRIMVYVGRSNLPQLAKGDPAASVYSIATHHVKMVCDVWKARVGVLYQRPDDRSTMFARVIRANLPQAGIIVQMPPGHGKTDTARFVIDAMLVENVNHQLMMNHAVNEKAWENLAYLASLYKVDSEIGRRHNALFPELKLVQCNSKKFRFATVNQHKSPSATASGVSSGVNGSNASILWMDDPVDQSEANEETQRKQTFAKVTGTWFPRMRKGGFLLVTATLWHDADTVSMLIKGARASNYAVSRRRCGGPNTNPPFFPVWQEMYPAGELRRIYNTMRNPGLYSAAYMGEPSAVESRIVRKLRYYDPRLIDEHGQPTEHARFLESSIKYLSLDPAATRGERSDHAGAIYAGFGSVRVSKLDGGRTVEATENRLRILSADSIPATQAELVKHTIDLTKTRNIDYVMVECRSGYVGTAEMFENYHDITPIRIDPRNKNKAERLKASAPALEDANAHHGLRAVVEIPGVWNESGVLVCHPDFERLEEEILKFGTCSSDDLVDAISQLVIYLSPDLGIGTGGIVNRQIAKSQTRLGVDPRLVKQLDEVERGPQQPKDGDTLSQWTRTNWSQPTPEFPRWN